MNYEPIISKILGKHTKREGEVANLVLSYVAKNPHWDEEKAAPFNESVLGKMKKAVKDVLGVEFSDVMGRNRHRDLTDARMMMYLLLREYGLSYPRIGKIMGKNHTTILWGVRTAQSLLYYNAPFRENYQAFKNSCQI